MYCFSELFFIFDALLCLINNFFVSPDKISSYVGKRKLTVAYYMIFHVLKKNAAFFSFLFRQLLCDHSQWNPIELDNLQHLRIDTRGKEHDGEFFWFVRWYKIANKKKMMQSVFLIWQNLAYQHLKFNYLLLWNWLWINTFLISQPFWKFILICTSLFWK